MNNNPSSFKHIRTGITLICLILLWVNKACAQELSWSEKIGFSNVTAQFIIGSLSPEVSKTSNQTVVSVYSDNNCTSLIASTTLSQGNFTFVSGHAYSVNATSFYQTCNTYLTPENCGNGVIQSVKIQPRISGSNIFTAPQHCFPVDASSGTKIVLTGSAANVIFR